MNHLLSYSDAIHPLYFLTRFIEGLRTDIRSVVMVQRPGDLNSACALAILQEEVAEGQRGTRGDQSGFSPYAVRAKYPTPLCLPAPPARLPNASPAADDRRGTECARASGDVAKVTAPRNYRRVKGLCFKCGERWGQDHTCPPTVILQVIEELLDLFHMEFFPNNDTPEQQQTEQPTVEQVWHLSLNVATSTEAPSCLQFHGWVQGQEVLMLVDSGTSASFVSHQLASKLQGVQMMSKLVRVSVANGFELQCTQEILGCSWYTQGHVFSTNFIILPLGPYNVILGMDWLEYHSYNNLELFPI